MNIAFAEISLAKPGALAVLVTEGTTLRGVAADLDDKLGGALKRAVKAAGFTGKSGSILEVVGPQGVSASRVLLAGLGKSGEVSAAGLEKAGGELVGRISKASEASLSIILDGISAPKLTAAEAALIVSVLPNPVLRDPRAPGPGVRRKAAIVARRAGVVVTG
ncbi:MAG: M17 family peptidase N-terminal domain-containing protein, partial [Parvibaculum sp.]